MRRAKIIAKAIIKTTALTTLLSLTVLTMACQDYPWVYRPNQRVEIKEVRELIAANPDTDILFVIDNSGSMSEEQSNLVRNTEAFIRLLAESDNDYRVGIVSTDGTDDTNPGQNGGRLRLTRASQATINTACNGLDSSTDITVSQQPAVPFLKAPDLLPANGESSRAKQLCALVEDFIATVDGLGIGGSGLETGLLAARLALSPDENVDVANTNAGFLRDDADLAIIFMTDEEDCSFEDYTTSNWVNSTGFLGNICYNLLLSGAETPISVTSLVNSFGSFKGDSGIRKVRAALIGGGVKLGEGDSFSPKGCSLVNNEVFGECGCWSSNLGTSASLLCEYMHTFGNPCSDASECPCENQSVNACQNLSQQQGEELILPCEAVPAGRYHSFITALSDARRDLGFPSGVFEDSICEPEYDVTLEKIAREVVLSDCFVLDEPPINEDEVRLIKSIPGSETREEIPRCDNLTTAVTSCTGGWYFAGYPASLTTICLAGDIQKETGALYSLAVLSEEIGTP